LEKQFGEGIFYFKKGVLKYKKGKLKKAKKDYNDEQLSLVSALTEVIKGKRTISVSINEDSDLFLSNLYVPVPEMNSDGGIKKDEKGNTKFTNNWVDSLHYYENNITGSGGAGFAVPNKYPNDGYNYGYLLLNRKKASTLQMEADGGKLTNASESSVFLHELLDHGLDFIRNGNTNKSDTNDVKNVKYHNQALKNISKGKSPLRNSHYGRKKK